MTRLIVFLIVVLQYCHAQTTFVFDKQAYQALNKWIVFEPNNDSKDYAYGFIYRDQTAGLTFNLESTFTINETSLSKKEKANNYSNVKVRLRPNMSKVAILSDTQIKQLGLPEEPEWLKYYKATNTTDSIAELTSWGRHYNAAGGSSEALKYLERAYSSTPHATGLEFELAFAYNALQDYDKAISVLNKAIENDPKNFWFFRELGFSYVNLNKITEAEKTYLKGIEITNNKTQKAEMAINMIQGYYQLRNKEKFNEWEQILLQFIDGNSPFAKHLEYFKSTWNNPKQKD